MRYFLPLLGIALLVLWVAARVTLAVTGFFLHLLWILAVIAFVLWLARLARR
jgi:hypothetical protein